MTNTYLGKVILKKFAKNVTAGISAIRRIKPFVDQDTLVLIYNAIVRPYFDYCCEVWDVFGETQSKRHQKLQNRAARIILNLSNDVHHTIALHALGWAYIIKTYIYVLKLTQDEKSHLPTHSHRVP